MPRFLNSFLKTIKPETIEFDRLTLKLRIMEKKESEL